MSNIDEVRNNIKKQIRDEYGKLVYTYTCHNKEAKIVNKRTKILKIVKLVLSGLSTAGFVSAIFSNAKIVSILGIIISATLFVITSILNEENMACSIASHNNAANQLWLIRENYVSLLSEFDNLSIEEIVKRRDELLLQTNKIYKNSPQTSSKAYEKAQEALKNNQEQFFEDWEIDLMLPKSLREGSNENGE